MLNTDNNRAATSITECTLKVQRGMPNHSFTLSLPLALFLAHMHTPTHAYTQRGPLHTSEFMSPPKRDLTSDILNPPEQDTTNDILKGRNDR
jgi:hypothetical protein